MPAKAAKAATKASAKASAKISGKAGKTAETVPAKAIVTAAKESDATANDASKSADAGSREAAAKLSKKRKPKKKQDAATAKDHDAFKEAVLRWWSGKGARAYYNMQDRRFRFAQKPYMDFMALHAKFKKAGFASKDKTRQWFVQILTREEKIVKPKKEKKEVKDRASGANKIKVTPRPVVAIPEDEKIIVSDEYSGSEESDDESGDDSMSDMSDGEEYGSDSE